MESAKRVFRAAARRPGSRPAGVRCLAQDGTDAAADALRRYEALRLPRTARLQSLSAVNQVRLHLPDGQEQRDRDTLMLQDSTDWSAQAIAWLYSHDTWLADEVSNA